MAITAPKSYDTSLTDLLGEVNSGKLQLPEFQRNWTWDDERIVNIIASLTQGYPWARSCSWNAEGTSS
jgi:uncharacterized protein with ParB-like and HNH nuclease domain